MILSIDFGTKRVGLAISDETNTIALTLDAIVFKKDEELWGKLQEIIEKYTPELCLIGIPLGYQDKPTKMSKQVKKFGEELKSKFNLEVRFWNEVMTSYFASKVSKNDRSGKLDSESARIILQEYLDFIKEKK